MFLNDGQIRSLAERGFIVPFKEENLNPFGYDLTLSGDFLAPPKSSSSMVLDPFNPIKFTRIWKEGYYVLPPHSFVLGRSVETIAMPKTLTAICLGRSTYSRAGIVIHVTPLEAGWIGTVTIEISNTGSTHVKLHVGVGISQVVFAEGVLPEKDYVMRGGKYQNQKETTQGLP